MKNYIKKIIVGFLMLVFILTAHSAFASGPFNGQSGDCNPTIGIGNFTQGNIPRDNYGCWTASSITAGPGDTINVALYYHNNTNSTLTNVMGMVNRSSSGPTNTYTFTGSMSSDQGSQTLGTVTLNLSSSQTLTYSSTHLMKGKNAVLSDTDTSTTTNEGGISVGSVPPGWDDYGTIVYVYKIGTTSTPQTCQDPNATNYGGTLPCTYYQPPQTTCTISSFYASPTYVTSGQPVTLSWSTNNCTSVSISGVGSNLSSSGSQVVYPSYTTNYTLNAYGTNGNPSQSVNVTVNPVVTPIYNNNACAVTTIATNTTRNSAQLNGLITNLNYSNTTAYFTYGPTIDLGYQTTPVQTSGIFNQTISGLSPNTIYFFRLVANCGNGQSMGDVKTFSTEGSQVVNTTTVINQGTTVIGTESPIMLKIEDRYQSIGIGDTVDYTVTYKNIGKSLLTNPILQVIIPNGIMITNSSAGTYSNQTNTLTVPLQDLKAGDEGVIYLQGRVMYMPVDSSQIVTTAILVYTSPNKAQENAIAYVLNNPKGIILNNNNSLGAAAFFLGIFPTTLLGWLLLILLILLIILVTRKYYRKSTVQVTTPGSTTTTTHY